MSLKKSKLDLLVRVRYSNPLPAPPCPPKLLNITTDPMRYARPEFLDNIASDTPLPMVVDAELGMPLDLSVWESLWGEQGDGPELNPSMDDLPQLDPADAFLAAEHVPSGTSTSANGHSYSGFSTPSAASSAPISVSWLRKTEYITSSREGSRNTSEPSKYVPLPAIDVSRPAQLDAIDASFKAANDGFDLSTVSHPNKPGVTAVESYELLPDAEIWANAYDLFRFSERPGERAGEDEDPRLDCAVLRPMESDGEHFLAYYLTQDDEAAIEFKERRFAMEPYSVDEDGKETVFHFVRDYETVKVEQDVPNEFLLVLDGGADDVDPILDDPSKPKRAKGAYYKNIERKMILKKRRVVMDEYQDKWKWDQLRLTHSEISGEEAAERDEALAEVVDPLFLLHIRAEEDRDAEGEEETDLNNGIGGVSEVVIDA